MRRTYKELTVQDIVNEVMSNPAMYPYGMNTKVESGDLEGNYTHKLHEIQHGGKSVCLAYEMHEGMLTYPMYNV